MTRVALDAMGSDHDPGVLVAGATAAGNDGVDVILVGDSDVLTPLVAEHGCTAEIVHAADVITMAENPGRAVRDKRNASIVVACRLVAEGKAQGLVSAGSTGASLTAAVLELGRVEGVLRPAIAAIIPTTDRGGVLLDAGANPECKPEHLYQFAAMGVALARARLNIDNPTVGLLNNGSEEGKGRALDKTVYGLLMKSDLNFVGNVEGRDLLMGTADVIVTDGFTGNAVLKSSEATAERLVDLVRLGLSDTLSDHPELAQHILPPLVAVRNRMNPDRYGGASLLGVDGVVTIAHGTANAEAIASALRMTYEVAGLGLVDSIRASVSS